MSTASPTLEQMVLEHVSKFSKSTRPGELIAASMEKLFADAIQEVFAQDGELASAVRNAVKDALPANVSSLLDLPRYNDLLATALKAQWASSGVTNDLLRRSQTVIDEVLKEDIVPEFVSLSELIANFVEEHQDDALIGGWSAPLVSIREMNTAMSSGKMVHVCFDPEPEKSYLATQKQMGEEPVARSEFDMANRLSIRINGANALGHEFGEVYSAQLEGVPIGRNFMLYTKWEKLVAALYFGGAKLVIDCAETDFSYSILH